MLQNRSFRSVLHHYTSKIMETERKMKIILKRNGTDENHLRTEQNEMKYNGTEHNGS